MKIIKLFSIMGLAALTLFACNKKAEQVTPPPVSATLTLKSDKTTITLGAEAILTATAVNFTPTSYTWSVNTSSSIIGSGSQVRIYASCPSCTGYNEVTCVAKDANNASITKKITITVTN